MSDIETRTCEGKRETCEHLAIWPRHLCDECEQREAEAAAERQYADWHGGSSESAESMTIRGAW